MSSEREMLWLFGKTLIETARDLSIRQEFQVLDGEAKAPLSKLIHEKIGVLSEKQVDSIKDLIIDAIDTGLNNFLWIIEQSEDFDLVCYKNGETLSLRDLSDGLCGDYDSFVSMFSKYKNLHD